MTKLLDALRSKYRTPEQAVTALGLPASCLDVVDRYILAQDAQTVTHRATGRVIDKVSFMKTLFAKENPMIQRKLLARDQGAITRPDLPGQPKTMIAGKDQQPRGGMSRGLTTQTDQDPDDPNGGGPNTGAAPPTDEEIVSMLDLFLHGSNDPAGTIEAITNWVVSQGSGGVGDAGLPRNNMGALDRTRSGKRSGGRDSRLSMDARAKNHSNFLKRHDYLKVDVWR